MLISHWQALAASETMLWLWRHQSMPYNPGQFGRNTLCMIAGRQRKALLALWLDFGG